MGHRGARNCLDEQTLFEVKIDGVFTISHNILDMIYDDTLRHDCTISETATVDLFA